MTINIRVTRQSDWDTSYDVWYKIGVAPTTDGDGIFIGNYPIEPDEDDIVISFDEPTPGADYGILAVPIQQRHPGIPGVSLP